MRDAVLRTLRMIACSKPENEFESNMKRLFSSKVWMDER